MLFQTQLLEKCKSNLQKSFSMPILKSELLIKFFWNHKVVAHLFKNVCILQVLHTHEHIKPVFLQDHILEI